MTPTASPVTPRPPEEGALSPVARLNDASRASLGGAGGPPGRVVVTRAVAASGDDFVSRALEAVQAFDAFSPENAREAVGAPLRPDETPQWGVSSAPRPGGSNGEHDFGAICVDGVTLWFKIDVYEYGAEDPADPVASRRVLTILLPDDY